MDIAEELVEIGSPSGRLEGVFSYPAQTMPNTTVLFLSPHPQLGGNMNNNVVRHLACGCAHFGFATLRFNYHGVGRSTMHDTLPESARGYWAKIERTRAYSKLLPDVHAAWDWLDRAVPKARGKAVIGYSLGAVLSGLIAERFPDATAIAIAPPIDRVALTGFEHYHAPKVFLTGANDFTFDRDAFNAYFRSLPEPKFHQEFAEEDHFFRQSEGLLLSAIRPFLASAKRLSEVEAHRGDLR